MNRKRPRYVFGPVPSRRLGRSLGIDPVPFKTCTYDCIYCQLGRTTNKTLERTEYVATADVLAELDRELAAGASADYITVAGSGEPTLNVHVGDLIAGIKARTRIPVAVLTNGSLLWMAEVRDALMDADLALPSLDAGDDTLFRHVNRPHADIRFETMVEGIADFTGRFRGEVWLEVMLLAGITAIPSEAGKIAALARRIRPRRVQLNTVCRPPAEEYACGVEGEQLARLEKHFPGPVEVIQGGDGPECPDVSPRERTDARIVALVSRRPSTVRDVCLGLGLNAADAVKRLDALVAGGMVRAVRKGDTVFYGAESG